jgi:hypothetical protein
VQPTSPIAAARQPRHLPLTNLPSAAAGWSCSLPLGAYHDQLASAFDSFLPPALREAEHWGWVLYADRQAWKEGRRDDVYERLAMRARRWRRWQIVGWFGVLLMVLNAVLVLRNPTYGALSYIAGWGALVMNLAIGLVAIPWAHRARKRLELSLERERADQV